MCFRKKSTENDFVSKGQEPSFGKTPTACLLFSYPNLKNCHFLQMQLGWLFF